MFYSDEKRIDYDEEDDEDNSLGVLFDRLRDTYPDFDDNILDVVNRVLWISRDIEILGRPLIPPTEDEMIGLRVLEDERNKFEKHKLEQADRKWQTEGSRLKSTSTQLGQ